jgi:cytochrome P450
VTDVTGTDVEQLARSFDPFDYDTAQRPHGLWRVLQQEAPVARSEALGGFYLLTRYADVWGASLDTGTFISGEGTTVPQHPTRMPPEDVDPPEHRTYRRILDPYFSPKAMRIHEPWIRDIVRAMFDAIPDQTRFDFCRDFSIGLPKRIICRMVGVSDDHLEVLGPAMDVLNGEYNKVEEAQAAGETMYRHLAKVLEERRSQQPRDDLISLLLAADFDGRPLDDLEIQHMLILIFLGGTETSSGAMGGMMLWLADHPEDFARLRDQPELMQTAIDEFVRYVSPVPYMARTVSTDTEVQGCPMHTGDKVLLGFGPGNWDPEKFDRHDEVVLDRRPNPHLGFGAGPHRCLGAHLVKTEVQLVLEEAMRRWDSFEVEDRSEIYFQLGQARNIKRLPLVLRPTAA